MKITNEKEQDFGVYCGNKTGHTVLVTGNYTLLKFRSDNSVEHRGFVLHLTAVPLGKYSTLIYWKNLVTEQMVKNTQDSAVLVKLRSGRLLLAETLQPSSSDVKPEYLNNKTGGGWGFVQLYVAALFYWMVYTLAINIDMSLAAFNNNK